ncbi:MAG: hypothetical protein JWM10_3715 [Myxococcaceae bacterium]|nr:hypothetical protein [Myxococcaceae bacterium]
MSKHSTQPNRPAVDPLAQTAPQPRVEAGATLEKPADVVADERANAAEVRPAGDADELDRLTRENRQLLDDNARLSRALDDARELLGSPAGGLGAELIEPNPADVVLALAEAYRVSQAVGGDRRQRYLDATLRAADRLADVVLGPVAPPAAG